MTSVNQNTSIPRSGSSLLCAPNKHLFSSYTLTYSSKWILKLCICSLNSCRAAFIGPNLGKPLALDPDLILLSPLPHI